jgi:hypothetical protein
MSKTKVGRMFTVGHKHAGSKAVMLPDRSLLNVVPFGMVYLLQWEYQGCGIWQCVREVNRHFTIPSCFYAHFAGHGRIPHPPIAEISLKIGTHLRLELQNHIP